MKGAHDVALGVGQGRHADEEVAAERVAVHLGVVAPFVDEKLSQGTLVGHDALRVHELVAAAPDDVVRLTTQALGQSAADGHDRALAVEHEDELR